MGREKKIVYTLTTSYLSSPKSRKHFIFFEDKALIDGGFRVKTIIQHSKGFPTKEIIDSIEIHRFRYLPEKYEITSSLPEALKSSFVDRIKVAIMSISFLITTFLHCIKLKPDLILAHWALPTGIIAFIMLKIFGIKFIVSIHGGEVAPLKKSKMLRKLVIPMLNQSSMFIVNGEFTEKEFIKMGINKEKIRVIYGPPNYADHSTNKKILTEFRNKITQPSNKIILCVARLVEVKGVEYLIRALPLIKIPNIHCLIVGNGKLSKYLKELATSLGVKNKITFYGRADQPELSWIYDISDIFVSTSIIDSSGATDSMPLTIPEAMESRLPVIGTNVGGTPYMIKNMENGLLVKQKDPKNLAEAINRILTDEDLKIKLIENSQNLVKKRSSKMTHQKYIEVVTEVLS